MRPDDKTGSDICRRSCDDDSASTIVQIDGTSQLQANAVCRTEWALRLTAVVGRALVHGAKVLLKITWQCLILKVIKTTGKGMILVVGIVGAVSLAGQAQAEMKYFQIARLLNFKTECQMSGFEDRSAPTGPGRFLVTCDNVTFYPDGLILECPDRDDEWTCKILTNARRFEGLEILKRR